MALVTVNGFLRDISGANPGVDPRIVWKLTGATVSDSTLIFSRRVVTIPNSDGSWSQQFEKMGTLTPKVYIYPTIQWFENDGTGGHWTDEDHPELKFVIPNENGPFQFTDIVLAPANPDTLIFEPAPPPDDLTPGTWYYDSSAAPGAINFYEGV